MPEPRLKLLGLENLGAVHWTPPTPFLYEHAIRRGEGRLSHLGPLVVRTGDHTGRSPHDKFIVHEPSSADRIWWGEANQPIDQDRFESLRGRLLAYLQGRDLFVQDCLACADPAYRVPVRVITETAWHGLFARNLFIEASPAELADHEPALTVIHAPGFRAIPELDGTRSEVFVALHLGEGLVVIGGTAYAGEVKKSVFTALNYLLPAQGVLSMHCAANDSPGRDRAAIFFGLSGTGKTSLSTDPERVLIGDDELGWSERGVFNLEGGCYAKVIGISAEEEPEIYETTRRFGTVLENVGYDASTGRVDLDDDSLTENTRAAYPISHVASAARDGVGGHPEAVIMLTADAFGVLPPVARLTHEQALYYFLSGYTAKVAGTETGVEEPQATFSPCFGAPFMALSPTVYAGLLGERMREHAAQAWLINTGWTGGPYGVGRRIGIAHTRAIVRAAIAGTLAEAPVRRDATLGLQVPTSCPGVPAELLDPRGTWDDESAYDEQAGRLVRMFADNFAAFSGQVPREIAEAGPDR